MRRLLPAAALAVVACSLGTEPKAPVRPPNAVDVTLRMCGEITHWFAYKNDGYPWVSVPVFIGQDEFTFPATPRVTIGTAYGSSSPNLSFSEMLFRNMTAAEVDSIRCDTKLFGLWSMGSSVKAQRDSDLTLIEMGEAVGFAVGSKPVNIIGLSSGTYDLVAMSRGLTPVGSQPAPPKVIVRHNITAANGGVIPQLDFTGSEARTFDRVRVRVGTSSSFTSGEFWTSRGTRILLPVTFIDSSDVVPAALRAPGDVHRFNTQSTTGGYTWFSAAPPADTSLPAVAALASSVIDTVSATPLRVRVKLTSQSEYPSSAEATFSQSSQTMFRSITVLTTAGWHGGAAPAQWELTSPDLTGVAIPSAWQLQTGTSTSMQILARQGSIRMVSGIFTPPSGESMRWARRFVF